MTIGWTPIMRWLLPEISGLGYAPSTRYAYYRVMDHFGLKKKQWGTFKSVQSKWRKSFRDGWSPETFSDSVRSWDPNGHGPIDHESWMQDIVNNAPINGQWARMRQYVEVWFEAEAMRGQFEKYVAKPFRIPLVPFRGDFTVAPKWERAGILAQMAKHHQVTILYFGDLDKKGQQIPKSALKDIRRWTKAPFNFVTCGLTPQQAKEFHLEENFERPGEYQWEGVPDAAAQRIIIRGLHQNVDMMALQMAVQRSKANEREWRLEAWKKLGLKGKPE